MTTDIQNKNIKTDLINPFMTDEILAHLCELTRNPFDAVVLAADGLVLAEYIAACTTAHQADLAVPELPKFQSQFLRDIGSAALQWLDRCFTFVAETSKSAAVEFAELRASRALSSGGEWTSAQTQVLLETLVRAVKAKVVN